jgi:hypothetical protein
LRDLREVEIEAVLAAYQEQLKSLFMYATAGSRQLDPEGFYSAGFARLRTMRDYALAEIDRKETGGFYFPLDIRRVA